MKVSKVMHTGVVTCRTADNLARAAELMWNNDIGCLPVIDEAGHVAGMITDRRGRPGRRALDAQRGAAAGA